MEKGIGRETAHSCNAGVLLSGVDIMLLILYFSTKESGFPALKNILEWENPARRVESE